MVRQSQTIYNTAYKGLKRYKQGLARISYCAILPKLIFRAILPKHEFCQHLRRPKLLT